MMYPWLPEWFNSIIFSFILMSFLNIKYLENIFSENTVNARLETDIFPNTHFKLNLVSIVSLQIG
jgi:hypothetical protein